MTAHEVEDTADESAGEKAEESAGDSAKASAEESDAEETAGEPVSPPPLVEAEPAPRLPPMPPSRVERLGARVDHDGELRAASEGRKQNPRPRAALRAARGEEREEVPTDRFGPTGTAQAAIALDSGRGTEGGSFGGSLRVGARFAVLERRNSPVSFTPTVSLLAVLEGNFSRQGLGLEARIGAALTRPLRAFFPFLQLYALIAGGFEGASFKPEVGWLRLGLGLQLNFLTLFNRSFTVGDFMLAFMGAIGAYFQALFGFGRGGGWGGGWGGGGGEAAILLLAVAIAVVVVPPVAIFTGMVVSLAAMLLNVELSYRPSLDPRHPALGEIRFGVGF